MKKNVYKSAAESETIKTEVVCPNDTNPMGMLQGGRLVQWMDIAAAVCAQTHSGKICVTVSINHVDFEAAANVGDIVLIHANLAQTFNTSMEIMVKSFARKVSSEKQYLISTACFTFVALDQNGKKTKVIPVEPLTIPGSDCIKVAYKSKNNSSVKSKND